MGNGTKEYRANNHQGYEFGARQTGIQYDNGEHDTRQSPGTEPRQEQLAVRLFPRASQ